MAKTIRLIYASTARSDLGYEDVTAILKTANDFNAWHGITGILCYGNNAFLQALEGERAAVSGLYSQIVQDARHSGCELLAYGEIGARSFPDWSMKLIGFEGAERRAILERSGSTSFKPLNLTGEGALGFLCDLAEIERAIAV